MAGEQSLRDVLRNLLQYGDLSFRDFVELALYHPEHGYYARTESPIGKGADFVTAPLLSPVFSFAIARLMQEFVSRQEGGVSTFVDIGCGDGVLVRALASNVGRFYGVDRALERAMGSSVPRSSSGFLGGMSSSVPRGSSGFLGSQDTALQGTEGPVPSEELRGSRGTEEPVPEEPRGTRGTEEPSFVTTLDQIPRDGRHLLFSNELFDAFPFARLVRRGEHMHELWVTEREGELEWTEHEAAPVYDDYFAERGIELQEGQFADVSLEWEAYYEDLCRFLTSGLIVTIDYGFTAKKLFHPRIRRFGTAASYTRQRVTRDLLANPGEQDLTAHVNFSDLERVGERQGLRTLFFDSLAMFLLSIGVTEHELFRPVQDVTIDGLEDGMRLIQEREDAKRLVLPDGIGADLRVLVQGKAVPMEGWSFQKRLFP